MKITTRKMLDRSFSSFGLFSIVLMILALLVILVPIFKRGSTAIVFNGTVEHRRFLLERFERGDEQEMASEITAIQAAQKPVYDMIEHFENRQRKYLDALNEPLTKLAKRSDSIGRLTKRRLKRLDKNKPFLTNVKTIQKLTDRLKGHVDSDNIQAEIEQLDATIQKIETQTKNLVELKEAIRELLGPAPGETRPVLLRKQYGQTRWDRAQVKLHEVLYIEKWDYSNEGMGRKVFEPRVEHFRGTEIEPLFDYMETNTEAMLRPQLTFYWGFLTDKSMDIHIFGGIFPELLGTVYLTLGAILFAVPMGVIAAIYFSEYARPGIIISFLRICISTLAGVPSIVFGMFGLAFLLNGCHLPKGVLAGSLTLALVILPTIIRSAEEAIRAVPRTYREAALSLGASRWRTVVTVVIPAALPGILTGTVISMGRAAGETAPIIFTAAASVAATLSLNPLQVWDQPTQALSWNIYNLCTEHEAANEIQHVLFGMTATIILVVLFLNLFAIILRARISKKLKGETT